MNLFEPSNQPKQDELLAMMRPRHLAPLWDIYERVVRPEPSGAEQSQHWAWQTLQPVLELAGTSVSGQYAEHRVLLLAHPEITNRIATTDNLLTGVQCVMPGERTTAHHHTAADIRFVLEGAGGETTVEGKACPLRKGDLVLTPSWTWHGHTNNSDVPVIWVDTLDIPIVGKLGASFHEPGPPERLPESAVTLPDQAYRRGGLAPVSGHAAVNHSARVHWPLSEVLDVIEHTPAEADGCRRVRYTDPASGGAITPTLDVYALGLAANQATRQFRCTGTAVCIVIDGSGTSTVGDQKIKWMQNDIFTLPNWTWQSHIAQSKSAHLLLITDRELYRRAGLLREQFAIQP